MSGSARLSASRREELKRKLGSLIPEIEASIFAQLDAIAPLSAVVDPTYVEGLRHCVRAAVSYSLDALGRGIDHLPSPPPALRAQAALAARSGVGLRIVLLRCSAGYALLNDYLVGEAETIGLERRALRSVLRDQAAVFNAIVSVVSAEYEREEADLVNSAMNRRAERLRRVLAGELLGTSGFGYEFDAYHLGVLAAGPDATRALREVAYALDSALLIAQPYDEFCWAWFGSRRSLDPELATSTVRRLDMEVRVGIGEVGATIVGWRLTHHQAAAALLVAHRERESVIRYVDAALVAAALQDPLLGRSLRQLYLAPLGRGRGKVLANTLGAYFEAERNISSAAVALGVSRQTVTKRIRTVEDRVGRSLASCAAEFEVALRLQRMDSEPHETIPPNSP
ncbi:MAG TPA: helix-turn-helix domain-containing protein [Solirubrobacterales bacterium]|nr:helix-turn-helix domain-containing protein [Solirubrobacterales bacterium]